MVVFWRQNPLCHHLHTNRQWLNEYLKKNIVLYELKIIAKVNNDFLMWNFNWFSVRVFIHYYCFYSFFKAILKSEGENLWFKFFNYFSFGNAWNRQMLLYGRYVSKRCFSYFCKHKRFLRKYIQIHVLNRILQRQQKTQTSKREKGLFKRSKTPIKRFIEKWKNYFDFKPFPY